MSHHVISVERAARGPVGRELGLTGVPLDVAGSNTEPDREILSRSPRTDLSIRPFIRYIIYSLAVNIDSLDVGEANFPNDLRKSILRPF